MATTSDASAYRRISLNEFVPDLLYEFPISLEIPDEYVRFDVEGRSWFVWMLPAGMSPTLPVDFPKPDAAFFFESPSLRVGYDAGTDTFIGTYATLEELQAAVEGEGIEVRRLERIDLPDFPILVTESVAPYEGRTRTVATMYLATNVDTSTRRIQFYFATGPETDLDRAVWKRFEASLTQSE